MAETTRLQSNYSKNIDDQVITTVVDPKEVERVSEKRFAWTPELKEEYEKGKKDLADAYEMNPATGRYKGTFGTLLGFNPDEYIKKQQQEEKEAQSRARWKYWGDIANTLIEIGTQHGGGTVWARKNNNELSEQEKKIQQARDNIFKVQQTGAQLTAELEKAYREAERKRVNDFLKTNEQTVTYTKTEGGNRNVTKSGGNVTTHRWWDAQVKSSNGVGGGGGQKREMVVIHNDAYNHISIPAQTYESVKNYLISHYCNILNEKDPNTNETTERAMEFRKKLQSMGILGKRNGPKWNASNFQKDEVMRNGEFFYLTNLEYNKIQELTGIDLRNPTQSATPSTQQNTTTNRRRSVSDSTATTTTETANRNGTR